MDRSHKAVHFQASNSPKSSATPKPSLSGENIENDINQEQMHSKSQNSKKPLHKHFMSPTVSATSKATVRRKKILTERNESTASFDVHFQKSPTLESRNGLLHPGTSYCDRSSSGTFSANHSTSQFDDDEQNSSFSDSSLKPYDPLTNYLSPRPQYLRYKPNRRRKLFNRQQCLDEKEDGSFPERRSSFEFKSIDDEIKSLDCVQDSLIPPSHEGTATLQNQEIDRTEKDNGGDDDGNDNEEEEEEEGNEEFDFEENRCSLKGVLKYLLLLVVIGLSTSYISSMNSPRSPLVQQSIGVLKDGCYRILNYSLEAIPTNSQGGNGLMRCTKTGEAEAGFFGVNMQSSYQEFRKVQMVMDDEEVLVDSGDGNARMYESLNAQNLDICVTEFDKSDTILDHLLNVNTAVSKDVESDKMESDLPEWHITDNLNGEMGLIDDSPDQNPGVEGTKNDAATEQELKMEEQSSQGIHMQETMEKLDSSGDYIGVVGSASRNEVAELENNLESRKVERICMENAGEELEDTRGSAGVTQTMEDKETHYIVETVEGISAEMVEARSKRPEIVNDESSQSSLMDYDDNEGPNDSMFEAGLKLMKAGYMELGPIPTACIGFSLCAIIFASLVYINPVREIRAPSKASQPVKVHFAESKRKLIQVQPHVDVECLQRKVESISLKPSTMSFSMEETRKKLSYNQAPKVELLGELVIGTVSSSIRSCGRESKINEAEESIKAISHEESRAHSVSPAQPSVLDTGSTDSPSYGSFTAETKILKKQGARDGSVKMVTTPVRRSSRIQNRSVTSP